jgi:hypothetical protein
MGKILDYFPMHSKQNRDVLVPWGATLLITNVMMTDCSPNVSIPESTGSLCSLCR